MVPTGVAQSAEREAFPAIGPYVSASSRPSKRGCERLRGPSAPTPDVEAAKESLTAAIGVGRRR